MNKNKIINATKSYVKRHMNVYEPGHDWSHIERVCKMAKRIGKEERADTFVVELAALLHDVADWKFHGNEAGPKTARKWLETNSVEPETISHVVQIIEDISFKGARVKNKINTIEGKVVQDADRLEALGAIGVARAFSYGGYKNRPLYDPEIKPLLHTTARQYENNNSTTITHFYEKLLLLKGMMNTKTGKKLAERRDRFMKMYLKEFLREWKGKD